jgi:hypothetical protein
MAGDKDQNKTIEISYQLQNDKYNYRVKCPPEYDDPAMGLFTPITSCVVIGVPYESLAEVIGIANRLQGSKKIDDFKLKELSETIDITAE